MNMEKLLEKLKEKEQQQFSLSFRERIKLVFHDVYSDWTLREFYKPFWFIKTIKDSLRIIFKVSRYKN